jgi:hypothetical protein
MKLEGQTVHFERDGIPPIDWGKRDPEERFCYTDRDGDSIFYVGYFTNGSGAQVLTSMWDGSEWIRKIPPSLYHERPLYNLNELYRRPKDEWPVILFKDERSVEIAQSFFEAEELQYVPTCWHGGFESWRHADVSMLRGRRVIYWPNNSKNERNFIGAILERLGGIALELMIIEYPEEASELPSAEKIIETNDFNLVIQMISKSSIVNLPSFEIVLSPDGFSNLESVVPATHIMAMQEKYGDKHHVIKPSYNNCMALISEDRAFDNLIKFDECIGSPIWDRKYYGIIDDVRNAILRRLSQYDVSPGVQTRRDITDSLMADPRRRVNTLREYLDRVQKEYLANEKLETQPIKKIFEYIKFNSKPDEKRYFQELFDIFMKRSALHIYLSTTDRHIPNDIVPVFTGEQGIGKGRFSHYIALDNKYHEDIGGKTKMAFGSDELVRGILGKIIVELGEMSVYRKADVETVKAFLSQSRDTYRQLYVEGVRDFPRTASFIGTGNMDKYLKDTSGNRRMFPMPVLEFNPELFDRRDLIVSLWAMNWDWAKKEGQRILNGGVLDLSIPGDLIGFFKLLRDDSMDLGNFGESFDAIFAKMESRAYSETVRRTTVSFTFVEIAKAFYGEHWLSAPPTMKEQLRFIMMQRGYEYCRRAGGMVFTIKRDDDKIVNRITEIRKYLAELGRDDEKDTHPYGG